MCEYFLRKCHGKYVQIWPLLYKICRSVVPPNSVSETDPTHHSLSLFPPRKTMFPSSELRICLFLPPTRGTDKLYSDKIENLIFVGYLLYPLLV